RADLPGALPHEMPWIAWITTDRIPAFAGAGRNDQLFLADPALKSAAEVAGWPATRLTLATWPSVRSAGEQGLAIIADTAVTTAPDDLAEFSSQVVLWEQIEKELHRQPLILDDIDAYLDDRASRLQIAPQTLARHR